MKIEFLGVGSGLSPDLGNNNVLLTSANSQKYVLIDCGFSTPPVLSSREKGLQQLTDILITHVHSDHIGGLELVGFTSFYVFKNMPNFKKITLHVPSESLRKDVWQALERGMIRAQTSKGVYFNANIETYFDVSVSKKVVLDGFSELLFQETKHVDGMEAYSVWIGKNVYYSSDTLLLPPHKAKIIFQDCQLFDSPTSVHTSFNYLKEKMDEPTKKKTYLMHYGNNFNDFNPEKYGFLGFVKRYQKFDLTSYV